jgi:hypothetical protein
LLVAGFYWSFLYLTNICDAKTTPFLLSLLISVSGMVTLFFIGIFTHGPKLIIKANTNGFNNPIITILGIAVESISLTTTIMLLKGVKAILLANSLLTQTGIFYLVTTKTHCNPLIQSIAYIGIISVLLGTIAVLLTWKGRII